MIKAFPKIFALGIDYIKKILVGDLFGTKKENVYYVMTAEQTRDENQDYEGFRVGREGRWEETYLVNIGWGENLSPSGDNYHWWGWQHDGEDEGQGIPHPDIPVEIVQAFEKWAHNWAFGNTKEKSLKIGEWEITPWRDSIPMRDDPSDYAGMGWIGRDGQP